MAETQNSKIIMAPPGKVFKVLTDPKSIEVWQVPGDMKGVVHNYDFKVGGEYEMSLFYPDTEKEMKGKSGDKEDKFVSKFIKIIPNKKIVEKIYFQSDDPNYREPMTMLIDLKAVGNSTIVTFTFKDIPKGIKPEDNEAGTISSLDKLAQLVEKDK